MASVKDMKVQTAIHLSIGDLEQLEEITKKTGKSRAEIVREALHLYFENMKKK